MKTKIKYLVLLLTLLFFSCKKEEATPPCKLSTIDRGNGNKHSYTYDANGITTKRGFADLQATNTLK